MDQYSNLFAFEDYLGAQARSIPDLPEVDVLSPRVVRVLGGNPGQVNRNDGSCELERRLNSSPLRCNFKEPTHTFSAREPNGC